MSAKLIAKNILITGSSRGIGRAAAIKLSQQGANIIIHYHQNKEDALKTLELLEPNNHSLFQANLADINSIKNLCSNVFSKYQSIDILVNNAAIYEEIDLTEADFDQWIETWERTVRTNLNGTAYLTFMIAKRMIDQGGGRIINVSSRGAFRGEPLALAYGASKAGLNSFGQSLSVLLGNKNIFVYTIAPGFVDTEMSSYAMQGDNADKIRHQSPLNRIATADEIASTIVFCASEAPEFMTGCVIDVNGASYLR